MTEDTLLTGPLEPTNEWYAIAKIAGIKLCQAYRKQYGCDFISAMPTNLYGPGDNFDLATSHVVWGSGENFCTLMTVLEGSYIYLTNTNLPSSKKIYKKYELLFW